MTIAVADVILPMLLFIGGMRTSKDRTKALTMAFLSSRSLFHYLIANVFILSLWTILSPLEWDRETVSEGKRVPVVSIRRR